MDSDKLFESIKLIFKSKRKINIYNSNYQFTVSSKSDIQEVINFFSFSYHEPLKGYKLLSYRN
jgi:hypothetical protein